MHPSDVRRPFWLSLILLIALGTHRSASAQGVVRAFGAGVVDSGAWPHHGQSAVPPTVGQCIDVAAGGDYTLALQSNGTIVAWGVNNRGQLNVPVAMTACVSMDAGYEHAIGKREDGVVLAWGANQYGQCDVPTTLGSVVRVVAGGYHSAAIRLNGTVVCWGAGATDAIGGDHFGQSRVPANLGACTDLSLGWFHSVGVRADGQVIAWGAGAPGAVGQHHRGQSSIPSDLGPCRKVAAGDYHTVALLIDGTVRCWGAGTLPESCPDAQCTYPEYGQSRVPKGLGPVADIAAGWLHSIALLEDGSAVSWGAGEDATEAGYFWGQANLPLMTGVLAIAGGDLHSVVLVADLADSDGDGVPDSEDGCPLDPDKSDPGLCGCGVSDALDSDGDGVPDCADNCLLVPNADQVDCDGNGVGDVCEVQVESSTGNMGAFGAGVDALGSLDSLLSASGTVQLVLEVSGDLNAASETISLYLGDFPVAQSLFALPQEGSDCPQTPDVRHLWIDAMEWNGLRAAFGEEIPVRIVASAAVSATQCIDAFSRVTVRYPSSDADGDGQDGCEDNCPHVFNPGQEDMDGDGLGDACDACPDDPLKYEPGTCGCGQPDFDSDGDGVLDCLDGCPEDVSKVAPGVCGCGVPDIDTDGDDVPDCLDDDDDDDGVPDRQDGCPLDFFKTDPGVCGCGQTESDVDGDGVFDCIDNCAEWNPGQEDADGDGVGDLCDMCPNDPAKTDAGECGCGVSETDHDGDGIPSCIDDDDDGDGIVDEDDAFPLDGSEWSDTDGDGQGNNADRDDDGDGTPDELDGCPLDVGKTDPGFCGCGIPDIDSDSDGSPDCIDACPEDAEKQEPGACGCGVPDVDSDADGTPDCLDGCPFDPSKQQPLGEPGNICGCDVTEDADLDGVPDCVGKYLVVEFAGADQGLYRYDVYLVSDAPQNGLLQVFGHRVQSGDMSGVHHEDAAGFGSWDPVNSTSSWDSFVTIDGTSGVETLTLLDPKFQNGASDGTIPEGAGWFTSNPLLAASFGQGGIRVARVVVPAETQYCAQLSVALAPLAGQQSDPVFAYGLEYCIAVDLSDDDSDGVPFIFDNCPQAFNPAQADCDSDGVGDSCDLEADCDGNGIPDPCEIDEQPSLDCNLNGTLDFCDIASGASSDIDGNGIPDECKADCNQNGIPDAFEIAQGLLVDCDADLVPDVCQLDSGDELDCDSDGKLDSCAIADGEADTDSDGRLDACERSAGDWDLDGFVGPSDLAVFLGYWGLVDSDFGDFNGDGIVSPPDLAFLLGRWGPLP